MNKTEFRQIMDSGVSGLKADEAMKYRIIREASGTGKKAAGTGRMRIAVSVAAAACVLVLCTVVLPQNSTVPDQTPDVQVRTMAAGDFDGADLIGSSGVKGGSVSNGKGNSVNSIWEKGNGKNYPIIGIDGQYYRMLSTPANAPTSLLSSVMGTVTDYTDEPALSGSGTVVSNICPQGTTIYGVSGMSGTVIGAEVNGSVRLFQRVSFNGSSLKGGESLAGTLQIAGRVVKIQLGNVGTVTDGAVISDLVSLLLNRSGYQSSGSVKADRNMLITLDNGIVLQLAVKDDMFSACGTWSCPEFFEAFRNAAQ